MTSKVHMIILIIIIIKITLFIWYILKQPLHKASKIRLQHITHRKKTHTMTSQTAHDIIQHFKIKK